MVCGVSRTGSEYFGRSGEGFDARGDVDGLGHALEVQRHGVGAAVKR